MRVRLSFILEAISYAGKTINAYKVSSPENWIAKKEVFELIDGQIEAVQTFIETVMRTDTDHVMEKDTMDRLNDLVVKVKGINEILSRDQMKVAFFGRTSNGKSTSINAMLWDKGPDLKFYRL